MPFVPLTQEESGQTLHNCKKYIDTKDRGMKICVNMRFPYFLITRADEPQIRIKAKCNAAQMTTHYRLNFQKVQILL